VRALVLAAVLVTGVATIARAENEGQAIKVHPDSTLVSSPEQNPPATAEPAPVVQAPAQPAPAPAAAPAAAPVVASKPWPEDVPSLKPGTEKALASTAPATTKVASATPAAKPAAVKATAAAPSAASAASAPAAATTATQVAALPPQPANAASLTPTKVTLQATLIVGAPPLHEPLQWTVSKPGDSNKKIGLQVASMTGARGEFSLPPGDYVLTIKQREAVITQPLTVGSVAVVKTIPINTSIVAVRMIPYTGGSIVTEPIHWEVFATGLGPPGPNSKVADAVAPMTSFTLAAGYYVVRSHYQDATSDLAMLVEPALSYSYTVDLYAANIAAQVVGPAGKSTSDVKWQIVRSAAEADGTHKVVATDKGANPTFLVREGSYMVIATGADGSVGEAPLAVLAGHPQKIRVTLKPGATATLKTSTNS
jgi:hypothetical protein